MKNLLVAFIFIALTIFNSYSQFNILDSSREKLWYVVRTTGFFPPFDFQYQTTVLKLGDSVISKDSLYNSVLATANSNFAVWDTLGFIRESNRKVFYNPFLSDSVYLLYDFNIKLDSSFNLVDPYHSISFPSKVEKIDSVLLGNEFRKRFTFTNLSEVWIEGIGSIKGLLHKGLGVSGAKYELSCYSENGIVLYHNPTYTTCYCTTDIDNSIDRSNSLYANKGNIYILNRKNAIFKLFSISGLEILHHVIESDYSTIKVSMLTSGVYFYSIVDLYSNKVGKVFIDNSR